MNKVTIGARVLTPEEKEQLYLSVVVRIGFIETGTIHRAKDLVKSDKEFVPKVLTTCQMKVIITLEELVEELFK